ncbi:MAG: CpaF/VirB11 family protein, partial [Propionicimonas sp.]
PAMLGVAPQTPPAATPRRAAGGPAPDWALVRALRAAAAARITDMLADDPALDLAAAGPRVVTGVVADHISTAAAAGTPPPTPAEQTGLVDAVGNALFGLGRLQPLVDDPRVENIEITGADNVLLVLSDGSLEQGPPVADSDAELLEQLTFLAARTEGAARMFSPAHPRLHLTLGDTARLAATAYVTPRPTVVIRVHRLRQVTLSDLVGRDMLDPALASLLAAAVRAGKSIVVSGPQGSGKTTLIRALAAELDPYERVGTLETERELHLHALPDRHHRVVAWEARVGSGERGPDGRPAGEITLDELVADSLRYNLSRLIVGEVRGPEVLAMFKAMQTGAGSMSTTHAHSARAAIERLVTCAMEAGPHVTDAFAYRQVAAHINLIVQTTMRTTGGHHRPTRTRYVTEVIAVEPGEDGRPATTSLWAPDPATGRAIPGTLPASWAGELAEHGFTPGRGGGHR